MKFDLEAHFKAAKGTVKNTGLVFVTSKETGEVIARAKTRPKNPRTQDQIRSREIARVAVRCWSDLGAEARAGWQEFTVRFGCAQKLRRALDVCREAQRMRLILGLPTTTEAPHRCFPAPVTGLTPEPCANPNEFRFRVEHALDTPAGHMVLVKITPPMPTAARTPREPDARAICGLGPASAAAMPGGGGVVAFSNARFAIEPGKRFGVALTVIRAEDGLASPVAFFDVIRT